MVRQMAEKKSRSIWFYLFVIIGILLFVELLGQFLGFSSYSLSTDNSQSVKSINVNGMSQIEDIDYPSQTIKLSVNGQANIVTVTRTTIISKIDLNGMNNVINLCNGIHSPEINKNGLDNSINYRNC